MSEQVEVSQPKFELTDEQKTINGILYTRIRAIKDFADVNNQPADLEIFSKKKSQLFRLFKRSVWKEVSSA